MRVTFAALALVFTFACKHPPPADCNALTPRAHATYAPSHVFGEPSCAMICQTGFLDCDGNESNGCETSTTGRAPHTRIEPGAFTACTTACEPGFCDCDDDPSNGCEQPDASSR